MGNNTYTTRTFLELSFEPLFSSLNTWIKTPIIKLQPVCGSKHTLSRETLKKININLSLSNINSLSNLKPSSYFWSIPITIYKQSSESKQQATITGKPMWRYFCTTWALFEISLFCWNWKLFSKNTVDKCKS